MGHHASTRSTTTTSSKTGSLRPRASSSYIQQAFAGEPDFASRRSSTTRTRRSPTSPTTQTRAVGRSAVDLSAQGRRRAGPRSGAGPRGHHGSQAGRGGPAGERGEAAAAGRHDPAVGVDGPTGRPHLLVQPPLVRVHRDDAGADGRLGLADRSTIRTVLPKVLERWKGSIASGEPFDMVFPLKGADEQFRPFLTRVNPLRDEDGRILYWFGTNTDISDIKRMEEALRDADRRKDEFLATLAHELRNPLAPIRNSLQILKMPRVDAATVEQSRAMMERQVHQLVRLVDDLMDVSRVMRGKIEFRKESIELANDHRPCRGDGATADRSPRTSAGNIALARIIAARRRPGAFDPGDRQFAYECRQIHRAKAVIFGLPPNHRMTKRF